MVRVEDILVLSIASFLGNVGVALTGFGMAIIYLFIYQIVVLSGYDGDFRYAVFIQALALFSAQPLLLKKAEFKKYASWKVLRYFIPITIISTPLGQITGDVISTGMIEIVAGFLVTFVATFEMYQKRNLFAKQIRKLIRKICCKEEKIENTVQSHDEENPAHTKNSVETSRNKSKLQEKEEDEEVEQLENMTGKKSFADIYKIGKTLGEGAFSVVKEGTTKKLNSRSFAIKIVEKSSILEEEETRLKQEIAILQETRHENILFLHEVYDEPQAYYLVADLMRGGDLLTRLQSVGFFPEGEACRISKLVLNAVCHLHDHKIAHRDLKPENILFTSNEDNAQVKIADFGFARKETTPNSFTTMCGTPAYVAPEILNGVSYGCKVDMWSFGIIVWVMIVGYQPFRGDTDQEVQNAIKKGKFTFDEEFWKDIDEEPKDFISSLLVLDPAMRASAKDAQSHQWLLNGEEQLDRRARDAKVFFMVGSQRSGSNWLRTMLNEREDLAGPHPPHIMRDVLPIIDKFGDLSNDENFRVLVDHVCTFVERNQVPWTDKHGSNIKFLRPIVYAYALKSCMRVRSARPTNDELCNKMYLLSVFDAIMTYYTKVNGKRTWICKSMGMSQHHDLLLEFYGAKRLRYIYLVRDPRDVAMSFMKTPVGDCHWHAIATKWTKLQRYALRIVNEFPELLYKIHYENILNNKENEVKNLYDFIGEHRFGGVKRQASVLCMENVENIMNRAKDGRESLKACRLSYQFKNLVRGHSFAKEQNKKWAHPETGLKTEEIQMIETVAHEMMEKLGYSTHLVGAATKPTIWSDQELEHFIQLNQDGILKMKEDLAKENPDDLARRVHQAKALKMVPQYQSKDWESCTSLSGNDSALNERMWKRISNYLNDGKGSCLEECAVSSLDDTLKETMSASIRNTLNDKLSARRHVGDENSHVTKSGMCVRWASGTQSGYYANQHNKPNQDMHLCQVGMTKKGVDWFGVYDGNGSNGHQCAEFAKENLPEEFEKRIDSGENLLTAMEYAFMDVHKQLIETSDIETDISGTTATTLLLVDDKCIVSNVGDSPVILGWQEDSESMSAKWLCREHTPKLSNERDRIKRAGGVVMTADQRDGLVPMHENWREDEAPRVWSTTNEKFPGCAFTRSIGNGIAHTLGVTARPEFSEHCISKKDRVLIVASDGITEFMDAQTCVTIACSYKNPAEAANALIHEASERWISRGDYMDDISVIVLFFDGNDDDCSNPYHENGELEIIDEADSGSSTGSWNGSWTASSTEISTGSSIAFGNEEIEVTKEEHAKTIPIGLAARLWTLFAGATSGFLGGLCGIRGPPIILYFLHPPHPVKFDKNAQRATGAVITATNVAMRVVYYFVETFAFDKESFFTSSDWLLYVCVVICSLGGVLVGSKLFDMMKDSRNNIRMILSIFLLLCGVSLLLSSFHF